jgi:hypothetical protein
MDGRRRAAGWDKEAKATAVETTTLLRMTSRDHIQAVFHGSERYRTRRLDDRRSNGPRRRRQGIYALQPCILDADYSVLCKLISRFTMDLGDRRMLTGSPPVDEFLTEYEAQSVTFGEGLIYHMATGNRPRVLIGNREVRDSRNLDIHPSSGPWK